MPEKLLVFSNKSTIDRLNILSILRAFFKPLSRLWPSQATRLAEALFRTPLRTAPHTTEKSWLSQARHSEISYGEQRLAVWTWGVGKVVLLVHGWGGRGSQLGALAQPLVARGFRVVCFDAPGHGRSPGRSSSLVEMAEAIVSVAHAIPPVDAIVAHSAGAAATTIALRQLGLRPPRRLVYIAPGVDISGFVDRFAELLGMTPEIAAGIRERIERRFGISFDDLDILQAAPRMQIPLHIVHDRDDRDVAWSEGRALAERWPGATLHTVTGQGHHRILRTATTVDEVVSTLTAERPIPSHSAALETHVSLAQGLTATGA